MEPAKLIVCERSGRWASALRRLLTDDEVDLVETRSISECRDEMMATPESLVVVEFSPTNAAAAADLFSYADRWLAASRSLAVADREHSTLEPIAREAGAVDFVTSPRQLPRVLGMIRRHFARASAKPKSLAIAMLQRYASWS
jgi:hypothetical protein